MLGPLEIGESMLISSTISTVNESKEDLFQLHACLELPQKEASMNLLILPWIIYAIVSQPPGNALYIDDAPNTVTRYQFAQGYGLMAHARPEWEVLQVGQVIYADQQAFRVTGLYELIVLSPTKFRDEEGKLLNVDDVDKRFFNDSDGLTLMTCFGSESRLFVVAKKVTSP